MSDLWTQCQGRHLVRTLNTEAYRVVESQHRSATRKLVDTLEEHELLEALIEKSKPIIPPDQTFEKLHYLLFTPFRYPPLRHGSRFGSLSERALWYGSIELETALAEVAFYRFFFLLGSAASTELLETDQIIEVELTSFMVKIHTLKGIDLTLPPFVKHKDEISSPVSYAVSLKSLVVILFTKKGKQNAVFKPDYALFHFEDRYIVGYGLDHKQQYRNLPGIYELKNYD